MFYFGLQFLLLYVCLVFKWKDFLIFPEAVKYWKSNHHENVSLAAVPQTLDTKMIMRQTKHLYHTDSICFSTIKKIKGIIYDRG